ncbi:hypothetical protein SFUMM280S_02391 [Streptomyces fumanus]
MAGLAHARPFALLAAALLAGAVATPAHAVDGDKGFTIRDPRITESSGLAASRLHPGIDWTHERPEHQPVRRGAANRPALGSPSFDSDAVVEVVTMDDLMSTTILENPDDLAHHARTFDLLQSAALSPAESAELIQSKLRTMEEDPHA